MDHEMAKALQAIAKAVEDNDAVESVVIRITVKKQKPDKADQTQESK